MANITIVNNEYLKLFDKNNATLKFLLTIVPYISSEYNILLNKGKRLTGVEMAKVYGISRRAVIVKLNELKQMNLIKEIKINDTLYKGWYSVVNPNYFAYKKVNESIYKAFSESEKGNLKIILEDKEKK